MKKEEKIEEELKNYYNKIEYVRKMISGILVIRDFRCLGNKESYNTLIDLQNDLIKILNYINN